MQTAKHYIVKKSVDLKKKTLLITMANGYI